MAALKVCASAGMAVLITLHWVTQGLGQGSVLCLSSSTKKMLFKEGIWAKEDFWFCKGLLKDAQQFFL